MQKKDSDEELEKLLASLEPMAPSEELKRRIGERIEDSKIKPGRGYAKGGSILKIGFTLVSAVAAVWAVLLVLGLRFEPPRIFQREETGRSERERSTFVVGAQPIDAYSTLLEARPSPVFYLEDGQPVQQISIRYLDTEVWPLDAPGQTVSVSQLRDEIRLIPATTF